MYPLLKTGEIEELKGIDTNYYPTSDATGGWRRAGLITAQRFDEKAKDYPFTTVSEAINAAAGSTRKTVAELEAKYKDEISRERQFNAMAEQIAMLAGGGTRGGLGDFQGAVGALSGERNFATSDLSNRLNFQVSDQQILDDFNQAKLGRLNRIVTDGNAQIAG